MSPSGSTTPESKVQDFNRNLPEKDGPFPNTMRWFYGNERGDTDRRFGDETYLNEDPIFFRDRDHLELDNSAKDLYKFATKETDPEKKEAAVQRLRRYEMWRQGRNEKPYEYINKEKRKDHVKTFDRGNGLNYSKMFQAGPDHAHEHMTDEKRKAWSNAFYGQDNATDQKRQALLSGLISEWSQIPVDQVDKNYDAYLQAFMDEIGVQGKVDDAKAFTESSRWLKRRTEQAQNRNAVVERTQEIIDRSIISGLGSKETLDAATDELLNEFGEDAIDKATLTQAVQRSWTAKVRQYAPYIQDARSIYETAKSSIDDSKSRSKDSSIERRLRSVASLNREDRHNLLYLIYKMAEQDAGEHEGGFGSKVGKSFLRGVYDYVDNQLDALEIVGNVEIESGDKSVKDWQKNKTTYERSLREFRQDLRGIRDIVRRIESDNGAIQGIYDAATSVPYTLAAAAPYGGGIVLNALAMSTQNDMELRTKYPDMNPDLRWKMASGGGAIQSLIERAAFRAVIKPFPKLQGAFNKIGIRGTAGTLASRIGGGFAIEYGEEAFQEITVPVIQDIAGIFNEEIPDVTAEEWEHHTRIFRGDSRTAWAVLPLAVIMGGGSTAIDRIGAGKAREFLGRADAIWLAGVTQEEAEAISTTKDPLKAQKMLLAAVEAKTDEELNDNKKQAIDDGAENRLIEKYVEEHGTKEEKANLRAETALTNFENKFYPSVKQSEDGRYEVRYPELHNKPSEFFDTEAEAGAARDAILEDMGEQDIREMELSEANIKAMQLAKDSLEESHEGAEIKISKKADITLEKAVEQGLATIDQLMERVNIYAVSQGKANSMTWDEAKKKFTLPGQVMLKQKVRGYVARLTRGAGVQTIYEEGAEGYIRDMMQNEMITEDFLTFHLRQYEQDTGEQLFQYKDKQSSQEVVEAFSKLAQAHIWNSRGDERMNPKLGALIDLLRQFFKAVLKTAENLLSLKKQGLLDQEFEKHLDRAVGLDEEQILENQRREHEREMLEEMADPDTEIQIMMKGQLMRPSDMEKGDLMYGEVKDLYDHFRKESKSKKTKDGKSRVSSAGASVLFAKKGEGVELDLLREKLNEQGFEFDTPADMLEALDMSMRGMRQFPTIDPLARQQGEQGRTFSIGRAAVTHNKESQHFQTKYGGLIGPASFSIEAFHGTPHKVEKFSTENIGTGEGAQAYGWGLYFAEDKAVSERYRIALAYDPEKQRINGRQINDEYSRYTRANATQIDYQIAEGLERLMMHNSPAEVIEMFEEEGYSKEAIDYFKESDYETFGGLYQVELNVEQDELLDWDKPLSEQSDKVLDVLPKVGSRLIDAMVDVTNGMKVKDAAIKHGVNRMDLAIGSGGSLVEILGGGKVASEALASVGIKGIKYLDGDSRNSDWKLSSPEETKAGDWMAKDSMKPFSDGVHFDTEAEAQAFVNKQSQGTHNYVIFNDKDITITAENGEVTEASTKIKNHSDQGYDSSSFSIGRADRMGYYSNHGAELSKVQENEEGDLFAWRRGNESYKGDGGRNSSNQSAYRGLQEKFARWAKKPDMAKAEAQELIKELNEGDSVDMWLRDMFTHDKAWSPIGKSITNAEDAFAAFSSMRNPFIESLRMLVLDGSDKVIHSEILTVGSLDQSIAAPRDFLRVLAAANSEGTSYNRVVIAHNHPGGDPSPSRADVIITKRVKDALELVDAKLVDHIITNGTKGYSFESQDTFEVNKSQDIKWSVSERVDAQTINNDSIVMRAAQVLRAANPKNNYAILLSTRLNVMGLVVLPARPAAAAKTLLNSASNTGASAVVLAPSKSQDWTYRKKIASALDTAQIRFLDSIEWSKHNNKWESAQTLGLMEDKSSFSIAPNRSGFYSQLERVVDSKMGKSATPQQIMGMLNPAKGSKVKAEEIKWSGIEEALPTLAKNGKVSKAELLDYLRTEGGVEFEEVSTTTNYSSMTTPELRKMHDDLGGLSEGLTRRQLIANLRAEDKLEDKTKYAEYQLPGGENYREVVLAMPSNYDADGLREFSTRMRKKYGMNFRSEMNQAESDEEFALEQKVLNNYKSNHFSEVPNYLAHMRLNERDGGLFIEEIQSDRHQDGRKKGYKEDNKPATADDFVIDRNRSFVYVNRKSDGSQVVMEAAGSFSNPQLPTDDEMIARAIEKENNRVKDDVAEAPYRNTDAWAMAMFKRALRDAVESGKTWIGWTTGETQNDRYDLSKHVDTVTVEIKEEGNRYVRLDMPTGDMNSMLVNSEGVIIKNASWKGKALDEVIGKDLADKVMASTSYYAFKGEDLKVGGAGMKGFYDKMLPKAVQKYVKKWGGKVEKSSVTQTIDKDNLDMDGLSNATPEEITEFENTGAVKGDTPIWRVDITREMMDSVNEGQSSFSLGQVEDPVITKLQSLMRDPDTRVAFYKVAQRRLERVRTEIATREIKAMMSEQGGDDRIAIMDGIAQLQALASALPVQIRAKLGGEKRIASYKTTRGVNNFLKNRLDKIDNLLEKHIREEYIERIDKLIEKATPKKGNAKVAKGKITPEGHVELDEIVKVIEMSSAEVADAVNTAELDLSRAESIEDTEEREDAILKANAAIGRLSTFGNLKNKKDPISAQGSQEAHAEIDYLVTEGRSRYMLHLVAQKEHRQDLKRRALEVITGGRGRKLRSERLKEGENNQKKSWLKQEHARNVSFEMMLNGLSRMDKGSATLDSWLNQYFGQAVHKATHGEAIAANRKKLELLRVVAAVYELDTESVGWQGTVEDVMTTMSERHADSGIFIEEQAGKQVLKSYRAEVEAIASGEIDVVHSGYGWVRLSKREIEQFKALLEADNAKKKGQPKKNFEITRKTDGVVTEQYMSQDSAMFLTMMWKQIGLRPAMEAHGYNAEVMKQFEKFLTRESKLLRTWMFRQYDLNHDYFNTTFKKMFGVNLVKVKNYSPAKSVHGGRQVKDMIDASHGKQSTTPGMAMERIQHQAEPRYDVGAIQAYLQHVDATEHFVHWAEPVAELRSVFMDRDVRESILDHHGPETYAELIERIDMFADGGNMMAKTNRFADHLRKTFTVAKLAFNWGVFLKQLTSLPAYGFDMPVKDFLKYEAEFFSDMKGNWKKMWSLPYTQNRFDAGYDRDVMAVINSISKRKGKFAKAAEWGMVSGRAGDIIPVIVGGYTAYRYHFEKAKSEGKSDAQAEVIAVLQFEMSTDRAQQSGNIKDQSSYGLGGSLFRIFTMFQTSPRQYYSNMMEAILDAQAGRKGGGKRAAKAAFIAHVVLPSLFYWMSAGTRNLFRGDDDRDDLDDLLKGWVKSMALGPFSGVFLWGQIGQEMASGYEYSMPVFEFGKESMDASSKLGRMWKAEFDDDDATQIEAKDVIGFLDNIARTGSLLTGKGATWYDIGTRASKSVGFTKDRVERIMMGEVDSIVLDLGEIRSEIYEEKLPDKDEFPNEREEAKQIRYEKLAEEYSKTKAENPSLWPEIADKLKAKNKLPEAVEDLMD